MVSRIISGEKSEPLVSGQSSDAVAGRTFVCKVVDTNRLKRDIFLVSSELPVGTFATIRTELPSMATGMARILDIGDQFDQWHIFRDDAVEDAAAIASDWLTVSADLQRAATTGRREPEKPEAKADAKITEHVSEPA